MSATPSRRQRRCFLPSEAFVKNAHVSGMAVRGAVQGSRNRLRGYWGRLARELISWKTPFTQVLDESNAPFFKWFADGTLNASYNCLDRNIERGLGDKTALIFEADGGEVTRISYSELLAKTCQIANGLKSIGIGKGDRVIIYISMSIDGVVAMQACARIGAIHSVVFGGFSAQSVRDRIRTPAPRPSSRPTSRCVAASTCRSSPSSTRRWPWAAAIGPAGAGGQAHRRTHRDDRRA
jgi:acetyl-CoA synthetase